MGLISGPFYWRTEPVWTGKPAVQSAGMLIVQSDNDTGPSLNLIKRNFPQSSITWPNNSNVVTVTVFGSLYEGGKKYHSCMWRSVHPLSPILCSCPSYKNFNSRSVCDENKSQQPSALQTETSMNFPPENSLRPHEWVRPASSLKMYDESGSQS